MGQPPTVPLAAPPNVSPRASARLRASPPELATCTDLLPCCCVSFSGVSSRSGGGRGLLAVAGTRCSMWGCDSRASPGALARPAPAAEDAFSPGLQGAEPHHLLPGRWDQDSGVLLSAHSPWALAAHPPAPQPPPTPCLTSLSHPLTPPSSSTSSAPGLAGSWGQQRDEALPLTLASSLSSWELQPMNRH